MPMDERKNVDGEQRRTSRSLPSEAGTSNSQTATASTVAVEEQPDYYSRDPEHAPSKEKTAQEGVSINAAPPVLIRGLRAKKPSTRGIVLLVLIRSFITLCLAAAMTGIIVAYSKMPVLSKNSKRHFNALITGVSITLGLALVASLDGMVSELRWWVLSRRCRSRRKVELILKTDSMVHLIMLAARSRRYSIHAAVGSWIIIILLSQIGVAAIGLCYSVDTQWKQTLMRPGQVSISDLSEFQTQRIIKSNSSSLAGQQFTANSYGTVSLAFTQVTLDKVPANGTQWYTGDAMIFCDESLCRYYFHETSTESLIQDALNPVTITTLRYAEASSKCRSWPVVSGGDGSKNNITIAFDSGQTSNVTLPLPFGVNVMTYMTNITENCGFGCSRVYAFEASKESPWFYECNSTIGRVVGAVRPEHEISGPLARMASRSIALQGDEVSSLVDGTDFQYQLYPAASVFGIPANGTADIVGFIVSRFAIGALAAAAEFNKPLNLTGQAPFIGEELNVRHAGTIAVILALIMGVQLVLDVVLAWLAHRVVVPPKDAFSIAEVLRPMTDMGAEREGGQQENAPTRDDREIPTIQGGAKSKKRKEELLWRYCYRQVSEDEYDLYMDHYRVVPSTDDKEEQRQDETEHSPLGLERNGKQSQTTSQHTEKQREQE